MSDDLDANPKDIIRHEAIRHRDRLEVSPDMAEQASKQFFEKIPVLENDVVSAYFPKGKEIDPGPIVQALWERNVMCCLPVIGEDDRLLSFAQWNPGTVLEPGRFGIPVPKNEPFVIPDILIVPLVVFDQQGNRLGYGKGHYDATLKGLRAHKRVLAVGLAYAEQACLFKLPAEDHDQKLDYVVTPQRVFDFRSIAR